MKKYLLVGLLALTGCAGIKQVNLESQQALQRVSDTAPTCSTEKECTTKWDAAQYWVSSNAGYKIQTASSAVIETYNPTRRSREMAMKVLKEPLGEGKYALKITAFCNSAIGCKRRPEWVMQEFNDYINGLK
jgi:hypothetical protein